MNVSINSAFEIALQTAASLYEGTLAQLLLLLVLGILGIGDKTGMTLGHIDGIVFLIIFAAYIFTMVQSAMKARAAGQKVEIEGVEACETKELSYAKSILFLIVGAGAIAFGGDLTVDTASRIAIELGMNIETIKATRKIDGKTLNHIESTDNDFFSNQMEEKSPEEIILESEKRKALADKINSLPEVERVVLKMHFCEQKSQREIARETGLKTDEIRKSKERGIKQLRMRLKNDYSVKERNQEDDISFLEEDMSDAAMEMLDLL